MKCGTVPCEYEATARVFWPGRTLDLCAACALRAQNIGTVLGFDVAIAIIRPEEDEPESHGQRRGP